ncbi:hypothetical protein NDU88_006591 [Pleurodeles waltl]|uniref:Uncharacterized protein n=1 Tax=Pleurodeles waltl TaxID=8319 RepID=A0AAV7QIG1_PLEWA|nr:hypothetical protein NDU88_006591 [Pleurodeles waltl]
MLFMPAAFRFRICSGTRPPGGAWPWIGTWRTLNRLAPEGPTANCLTGAPARAIPYRSAGTASRADERYCRALAAVPARAFDCVGLPGAGGGLRPLLLFDAAAPSGDAGRDWTWVGGPRAAPVAYGAAARLKCLERPTDAVGPDGSRH